VVDDAATVSGVVSDVTQFIQAVSAAAEESAAIQLEAYGNVFAEIRALTPVVIANPNLLLRAISTVMRDGTVAQGEAHVLTVTAIATHLPPPLGYASSTDPGLILRVYYALEGVVMGLVGLLPPSLPIPSLSPNSGQMFTINTDSVVQGDEEKNKVAGEVRGAKVTGDELTGDDIDALESSQDSKKPLTNLLRPGSEKPLINVLRPSLNASPGADGNTTNSTGRGTGPVGTAIKSAVDGISNAVKNTLGSLGGQDSGAQKRPGEQ
jgi:hypothetical protein